MGIFKGLGAIHRANVQLKKIERELDELINDIEVKHCYSADVLRWKHQQLKEDVKDFVDIITSTTTSISAPYFFKRQEFHSLALVQYLGRLMNELDARITLLGG